MVARVVVGIPTVLCLWISEIIASLPGHCAVTVLELLTGTMLTGYGSISQADAGGSMPAALDELLLDGAQGAVRLEGDGPCLVPHREAGVPIRALRRGRRRYPDPARLSEAAPGAAIQYDHARKPNRPDYIVAQTVVSLSAVIGNSLGFWSVPLMSNLAVRAGNHGKLETMRAMVEEVSEGPWARSRCCSTPGT